MATYRVATFRFSRRERAAIEKHVLATMQKRRARISQNQVIRMLISEMARRLGRVTIRPPARDGTSTEVLSVRLSPAESRAIAMRASSLSKQLKRPISKNTVMRALVSTLVR
jgi:hypothetical protein